MKNVEGVDEPTRRRVAASVLAHGPSTAQQLADRLDLTSAAIRRHLSALVQSGQLVETDAAGGGERGRGRPAKAYILSEAGRRTFFQAYDALALELLTFLRGSGGDEAVRAFAENRAKAVETRCSEIAAEAPDLTPAEVLTRALAAEGHLPSTSRVGHGAQLCQHHCPVAGVAEQFPELCDAETRAFERVLGSHVQRLATIAHGDSMCTTHIPRGAQHHAPGPTAGSDRRPTHRGEA